MNLKQHTKKIILLLLVITIIILIRGMGWHRYLRRGGRWISTTSPMGGRRAISRIAWHRG